MVLKIDILPITTTRLFWDCLIFSVSQVAGEQTDILSRLNDANKIRHPTRQLTCGGAV